MSLLGKIMVKLGWDNSEFNKGGKDAEKNVDDFSGKLKAMATKVAAAAGVLALLKKAFNFGSEAYNAAAQAEGVERAFKKLNNPNLLNQLREATQGTVSDLELMQNAIQAKNFKIPLENLATYLKFANERAKATGQSVDYLVQSIVLGVGRKSPLILDNLGISALEVREEFAKTGDMAKAVSNIINREMTSAGEAIEGSKEKTGQATAAWNNFKVTLGETGVVKGVGDAIKEFSKKLADSLNMWVAILKSDAPNLLDKIAYSFGFGRDAMAKYNAEQAEVLAKDKEFNDQLNMRTKLVQSLGYAQAELAKLNSNFKGIPFMMTEQDKAYKKFLENYIAEKSQREGLIQGIETQISALEELRKVETSESKLAQYNAEIQLLQKKLEKYENIGKVAKQTNDDLLANAGKGSIAYLESELRDLEFGLKLAATPAAIKDFQDKIKAKNLEINVLLNVEYKTERQAIEDAIKQYEDMQLAIPIGLGTPEDIAAAQAEWDRLAGLIKQAKEGLEKFPKAPEIAPPPGSLAAYDKEIGDLTESIAKLTGGELDAAMAARSFAEIMQQGASVGWKTQLELEVQKLEDLKTALKGASEERKKWLSQEISAQQELVDNLSGTSKNIIDIGTQLSSQLGSALASSFSSLFEGLLSGDEEQTAEEKTQAILQPFAQMVTQLGEYAIAMGVAGIALKKLIQNPYLAIAAGVALVALGKIAEAGVANITSGKGSPTTPPNTFTGGYSYSGSSNASVNQMQLASPQPQIVVLETKVSGSDIIFVSEKEKIRRGK